MKALAEVAEAVGATTKRNEKVALLGAYLRARPVDEAAVSALFLSGRVFPAHEETTLQVGGALMSRALGAATGATEDELSAAYRRHGDFGMATFDVVAALAREADDPTILEVEGELRRIAATRAAAQRQAILAGLLGRSSPLVAKYLVKVLNGDLRIGSKEALVEEAIAKAFGATLAEVQRANMMLGDVGGALRLAAEGKLADASMRLFHPLGFMLAAVAESAEEAFESISNAVVQDKYDGIRAQAHVSSKEGKVRLYSRTRDDVTGSFPDLVASLAALPGELILDGEVLGFKDGAALAFGDLQKRLGRKAPTAAQQRAVPVAYVAFDVLFEDGALVMDEPLAARSQRLDAIFAGRRPPVAPAKKGQLGLFGGDADDAPIGPVLRAPESRAASPAELDALFDAAQARNNEGLLVKDPASPYTPGRRGKAWLKLKRQMATLDVVVTGVEFGHGKRAKVLSDYTFAVRDEDRLVNIGKAYNGLTDKEIAEYTRFFSEHTVEDRGWFRVVEPIVVLEVAFNAIMKSERHASGFALRFPRIVRIRTDKTPAEANTLADARELFERQERGEVRG